MVLSGNFFIVWENKEGTVIRADYFDADGIFEGRQILKAPTMKKWVNHPLFIKLLFLCKITILTNPKFCGKILTARARPAQPEIPLYHHPSNLSIGKLDKFHNLRNPETMQSAGVRPWRTFTLGGHFTAVKR